MSMRLLRTSPSESVHNELVDDLQSIFWVLNFVAIVRFALHGNNLRRGLFVDPGPDERASVAASKLLSIYKDSLYADRYRSAALTELIRDLLDLRVVNKLQLAGDVVAQWAVRGDMDVVLLAELDELPLRVQRVTLDLVHGRPDARRLVEALDEADREVGHADSLDLAGLRQLEHGLPCLGQRRVVDDDDFGLVGVECEELA